MEWLSQANSSSILDAHVESFFSLAYSADPRFIQWHFAQEDVLEAWLVADNTTERANFISQDVRSTSLSSPRSVGSQCLSISGSG